MTTQPRRRRLSAPRVRERTAQRIGVRRIRWTLVIYLLLVMITIGKLVEIQVINADQYADQGVRQRARTIDLPATRGRVYDREGDVLATSVQSATVYADPRAFRPSTTPEGLDVPPAADAEQTAAALAEVLDLDADTILARLQQDSHFVYLARQLDHEVGQQIAELDLHGVALLTEPQRTYPAGSLAAQVVGFTGIDGEGLQGLEARYDEVLRGSPGMLVLERSPDGLDIASGMRELVPPEAGTDLVLTLDREIQHTAERAAAEAMEAHNAQGASVIVLEVASGEVLGMASVPGFDPNARQDADPSDWRNRAVTDVFEPGSTQKALTIAAAIEEGIVDADTTLEVAEAIEVGGSRFSDAFPHPTSEWSVAEIMERSSNVGTIEIARELGPERLDAYLRAFGYGRTTGSGFPGEASGLLMHHEDWWGTSLPTIAIGQGVAVTLLQMASSYATIANDGVAVTPRIVRGTVGDDGRLTPAAQSSGERVLSPDTARQMREMLEDVVTGEAGTGGRAAVDGYRVAGKTGTARKPSADARGYSGEYVATFVGFAPADDPRIVVAVMLDEPRPIFGGVVAAPLFQEVMSSALIARQVPPADTGQGLAEAIQAARERVAALDAQEASRHEDAGIDPLDPASPPVGTPAGGDGTPVAEAGDADVVGAAGAADTGGGDAGEP